ncbi:MAG: hypothetical protein AAGF12_08175, partial [Myxococcota bacterium]
MGPMLATRTSTAPSPVPGADPHSLAEFDELVLRQDNDGLCLTGDETALAAEAEFLSRVSGIEGFVGLKGWRFDGTLELALSTVGTLADLPALGWRLPQRVSLFGKIAQAVAALHLRGGALGPLSPERVLVDDAFAPALLGPTPNKISPYADPLAAAASVGSDVYTLGRLLHFLLVQRVPETETDVLPRLRSLDAVPAGLGRIVRRCVVLDPEARYPSVDALLADLTRYGHVEAVGLAHPDAPELNQSGLSLRPVSGVMPKTSGPETPSVSVPRPQLRGSVRPSREHRKWRLALATAGGVMALAGLALAAGVGVAWASALVAGGAGFLTLALPLPAEREL